MRSELAILIDTVRSQAGLTANYFAAKRDGLDEFTLARLQRDVEAGAVAALQIADQAAIIERIALAAVEDQLAALRSSANSDHSDPPPSAA